MSLFFFSLTQRIFLFDTMFDSKSKLIVFGKYDSNWTFFQFDSKNWTLFLECDSKKRTFFSKWLKELFLLFFFFFSIWLDELNPLCWICLNELNPFVDWLRELNPVFFFFNMTQRLDPLQKYDFQELNLLKIWIKGLNFWKCDSKHWTLFFNRVNESNPLFQHESKNFFFLNMTHKTQRIETSFNKWLEELNFSWRKTWPTELNHFFMWPRNRTLLSNMSHRNWTFLFFMTQRIEPFFLNMTRRMNLFSWIWRKDWSFSLKFWQNQRIEPSFQKWLKELNFLLELCLKELNFFFWKMTRRNFFQYDSKNWTFCLIQRIEPLFRIMTHRCKFFLVWLTEMWLKELNFLFYCDSNFFLTFLKWLKELNFFSKISLKKLLTFFDMTHRIELRFRKWLTELNLFFFEEYHS